MSKFELLLPLQYLDQDLILTTTVYNVLKRFETEGNTKGGATARRLGGGDEDHLKSILSMQRP